MLVGRPPFEGNNAIEVCAKHLEQMPKRPSKEADVPSDLDEIVLRLLAKDPDKRFQHAREVEEALRVCTGATTWTREDADGWWEEHTVAVSEVLHSQSSQQLTIDLDRS